MKECNCNNCSYCNTIVKLNNIIKYKNIQKTSINSLITIICNMINILQESLDIIDNSILINMKKILDNYIIQYNNITNREYNGNNLLYSNRKYDLQVIKSNSETFFGTSILNSNNKQDKQELKIYNINSEYVNINIDENDNSSFKVSEKISKHNISTLSSNYMKIWFKGGIDISFDLDIGNTKENICLCNITDLKYLRTIIIGKFNINAEIINNKILIYDNIGHNYRISNVKSKTNTHLYVKGKRSKIIKVKPNNDDFIIIYGDIEIYHINKFDLLVNNSYHSIYNVNKIDSKRINISDLRNINLSYLLLSSMSDISFTVLILNNCDEYEVLDVLYYKTYSQLIQDIVNNILFINNDKDINNRINLVHIITKIKCILDNYLISIDYSIKLYDNIICNL